MAGVNDLELGSAYFVQNHGQKGFGTYDVSDEELHPAHKVEKPHYALTETQYYGFWVPEANLHCFSWIWAHPNLKSVTAGTMAWTGIRKNSLACELFNFHTHMSMDVFRDGFFNADFDNGFSVHAEEAGKRFRIKYDDPGRGNSFDVLQVAASEPLMWPTSNHFEQVMKCTGEVTLRGKRYEVDCYSMRDRSWGEYRLEDQMGIPPNHWTVGTADGDNAFCIVGMEDEARNPMWKGRFTVPGTSTLRFGWLLVDGQKCRATTLSSLVTYDPDDLMPRTVSMHVEDEHGRRHEIEGRVIAATPIHAWLNIACAINLIEWNWRGRTFTGEMQTVMFNDFIHAFSR